MNPKGSTADDALETGFPIWPVVADYPLNPREEVSTRTQVIEAYEDFCKRFGHKPTHAYLNTHERGLPQAVLEEYGLVVIRLSYSYVNVNHVQLCIDGHVIKHQGRKKL